MRKVFVFPFLASASLLMGCGTSVLTPVDTVYPIFSAESTTVKSNSFSDGYRLEHGLGAPRDYQGAIGKYKDAEKAGDVRATNNLGVMSMQGKGTKASPIYAYSQFKKAANLGSANGHYNLALMNELGIGRSPNTKAAELSYRIAAEQGHAGAQYRLAQMIERGMIRPKHEGEAHVLFQKAAVNGNKESLERHRFVSPSSSAAVAAVFAVDNCDCEMDAERGMAARGAITLRELVATGDAPARYNLAVRLLQGDASHQDSSEAARLFTLAAKQGYGPAQRQLAQMHLRGESVGRSKILAHSWLNLASRHANADASHARFEMEKLEQSMSRSEIAEAQKLAKSGALTRR